MNETLDAELLHQANLILLERNRKLVEALDEMLTLEPTPEQRRRAIEVRNRERGIPS